MFRDQDLKPNPNPNPNPTLTKPLGIGGLHIYALCRADLLPRHAHKYWKDVAQCMHEPVYA